MNLSGTCPPQTGVTSSKEKPELMQEIAHFAMQHQCCEMDCQIPWRFLKR